MEQPKFEYLQETFGAQKIAYDLALAYAKAKLDHALQSEKDFETAHVQNEVNEIEFLRSHFLYALEYLSGTEPGENERALSDFAKGGLPFMR